MIGIIKKRTAFYPKLLLKSNSISSSYLPQKEKTRHNKQLLV